MPHYDPEDDDDYHFYEEPAPLDLEDTIGRLKRKYQAYKRATLIRNY